MATKKPRPTSDEGGPPGTDVVHDDAVSGHPAWSEEYLRAHHDKRRELVESPDGTPGKDVAQRVELEIKRDSEAAPLVREGVKYAREWNRLRGKEAGITQSLAQVVYKLRTLYVIGEEEWTDFIGRSTGARAAVAEIYRKAGLDDEATKHIQAAVRHQAQLLVYARLRELADGDDKKYAELCDRYSLNPLSPNERRRKDAENFASLPAARLRTDRPADAFAGVVKYVNSALDVPTDPGKWAATLDEGSRRELRDQFTAIQQRVAELSAALEDADD